jgi:chromate transporter
MTSDGVAVDAPPAERVGLLEIFRAFLTLGATSFGGGVVAYLREALVERERWLDDETFLAGLELSQMLPGLNATNMSVYVGERLRGAPGALVACLGMMLPGTLVVMALGILFTGGGRVVNVSTVLVGVGAAAVGLLIETTWKIGRPVIQRATDVAIIAVTVAAVAYFKLSLAVVLPTIGPIAVWLYRPRAMERLQPPAPGKATPK